MKFKINKLRFMTFGVAAFFIVMVSAFAFMGVVSWGTAHLMNFSLVGTAGLVVLVYEIRNSL
jgi:hypothetical protein